LCTHKHEKSPELHQQFGCVFLLVEAPAPTPGEQRCTCGFDPGSGKQIQKSASEIQNILNIKSGEGKKKPLDLEESRVNLMAEDEGE